MNSEPAQVTGTPAQGSRDDDRCFEVVQEVFVKLGSTGMYSDLFITAERLIFVRLAFVVEPQGGLAGTGADPVKGWARMAGLVDKGKEYREAMQNARTNAAQERKRFYGLSLKSRLGTDGRGGLVIPRGNVQTFKLGQVSDNVGVIEIVLANGNTFLTEIGGASQLYDRFVLWLTGKPVDVDCDRQGLDLSLPHPAEMLKWIEEPSKSPNVKEADCLRAVSVNTYCKELAEHLKKHPWLVREQLCQLTKDRCHQLAASIGKAMAAAPGGSKSEGVAFFIGVFGTWNCCRWGHLVGF